MTDQFPSLLGSRTLRLTLLLAILTASAAVSFCTALAEESSQDRRISVLGLVERPYNLSYSELLEMPSTVIEAELYCVDGPNRPVVQGRWRGVALRAILEKAGLRKEVVKIAFYASDGFSSDLALEDALSPDIILAYELNGERMQGAMGAPINRLVVPGWWGYKWVAGVERIEAVDYDFLGTWEGQGYPDKAIIAPPPNPAVTVNPTTVAQGARITVTGSGFTPSSPDPSIYLACAIIALVTLVAGKQCLTQKRNTNDPST